MKECTKCKESKDMLMFYKNKNSKDGLTHYCKLCQNAGCRASYKEHNEKRRTWRREYYSNNKEAILEIGARHKKNNREWYTHKENIRRASKLNATPTWAELDLILVVYEKAKWLEGITGLKYHVDHIVPLQGKNVCGLHVWNNLQILEASLNCSKSNKE